MRDGQLDHFLRRNVFILLAAAYARSRSDVHGGRPRAAHLNRAGTLAPCLSFFRSARPPRDDTAGLLAIFPMMTRRNLRRRAGLTILGAAFVSFLLSVTLWFTGSHDQGLFVGLWVPSILSFGCVALLISGDRLE